MKRQWLVRSLVLVGLVGSSSLILRAQNAGSALPGTVNYFEGQASIDGNPLTTAQLGHARVDSNKSLTTGEGKAEILLSPGTFVRVGSNSEVRMISAELVNPRLEVVRGEALLEVDQKPKDARIDVVMKSADTSILKEGLYAFNAETGIRVLDGKAQVAQSGVEKTLGKGKEVALNGEPLKAVSFNTKEQDAQSDLYRWSSVRSDYLAEANQATAQNIYMGYGSYWGTGWYWNPYFTAWSWLPGDGFFYSPFGYPFFSPRYAAYAPYGYGGFRNGFVARGGAVARPGFAGRAPVGRSGVALAPRGGFGGGARFSGGGHMGGGGRR